MKTISLVLLVSGISVLVFNLLENMLFFYLGAHNVKWWWVLPGSACIMIVQYATLRALGFS